MSVEAPVRPQLEQETRAQLAEQFLSSAKEIAHMHGKRVEPSPTKPSPVEPQVIYGNDVYQAGVFRTDAVALTDDNGDTKHFRLAATFKKTNALASLSAHLTSASLEEIVEGQITNSLTVNQARSEHQYTKADMQTLPSLEDLQKGKKILDRLRDKYAHQ